MSPLVAALLATERQRHAFEMVAFAACAQARELHLEIRRLQARIEAQRDEIRALIGAEK